MKRILILSALSATFAMIIGGCQFAKTRSATVVDSVVEGLEYQCAGDVHYTKADGVATCKHMPIGFKVGEIVLGAMKKMPADGIILPQDIVGVKRSNLNNENVKKMTVILQTLDADHNPENGIKITKETRKKLKIYVDLQHTPMDEIKDIIDAQLGDQNYTSPNQAITHLKHSMRKYLK